MNDLFAEILYRQGQVVSEWSERYGLGTAEQPTVLPSSVSVPYVVQYTMNHYHDETGRCVKSKFGLCKP